MRVRNYNIDRALNTIENADSIIRFIKVIHPVSAVPVEMVEQVASDSYHMIEEYMDRLVAETAIVSEDELLARLGLDENRNMAEIFLQELKDIEHIEVKEGRLYATELARMSLNDHAKYERKNTKRLIYFEATTLKPLPATYYDNPGRFFTEKDREVNGGYVFDEGDYIFDDDKLKDLKNMTGEERLMHNIPQELIDVKFNANAEEGFKSLFTQYYFAVFENGTLEAYDVDTLEKSAFFNAFLANNLEWKNILLSVLDTGNQNKTIIDAANTAFFSENQNLKAKELLIMHSNINFAKGKYECVVKDQLIEIIDKNIAREDGKGLYNKLLRTLLNYKRIAVEDRSMQNNYGKIINVKVNENQRLRLNTIQERELNKDNEDK